MTDGLGLVADELERDPDVVALAEVVSLASTIDLDLLRRARRGFVAHRGPELEADLWLGPLVAFRGSDGCVLYQDVAQCLLRRLGEDPVRRDRAWDLVRGCHTWTYEATTQREEELRHAQTFPDLEAERRTESLLQRIKKEQLSGDQPPATTWAAGLRDRVPLPEASASAIEALEVAVLEERLVDQLQLESVTAYRGVGYAARRTVVNALVVLLRSGRRWLFEGRRRFGGYRNWSGDRRFRSNWSEPEDATELGDLVRHAKAARAVGAGHSYNDGLATEDLGISLDRLTGIVDLDRATRCVRVHAGTRLRDLTAFLSEENLALRSLPTHDAQTIGGILATDSHGTGRGPAHLSDQVIAMTLVDGRGLTHELGPDDELFRATIGGIGSVGIVTQVRLQCVEAFRLAIRSSVESRPWVRANLDQLLSEHDHLTLRVFPFTDLVVVETADQTLERVSPGGAARDRWRRSRKAIGTAVLSDYLAHGGRLPQFAPWRARSSPSLDLVLDCHQAYAATSLHLHQRLEVAVGTHQVWTAADELLEIYESQYADHGMPYLMVEIRFTPVGHDQTLIGAGAERETAWLDLVCNQSGRVGQYFAAVEAWVRTTDARLHLGKWCEHLGSADIASMHGDRFRRLQQIRADADPDGRFINPFTRRVLGPIR